MSPEFDISMAISDSGSGELNIKYVGKRNVFRKKPITNFTEMIRKKNFFYNIAVFFKRKKV